MHVRRAQVVPHGNGNHATAVTLVDGFHEEHLLVEPDGTTYQLDDTGRTPLEGPR